MTRLSFQDAFFLRAESPTSLGHVAALMIFTQPQDAGGKYLSRLARKLGRLNTLFPAFGRKLADARSTRNPAWVRADDYRPQDHVFHYALPAPGRTEQLLTLVSHAHEQLLDRGRPLWQLHLIEGLKGNRFAVYFKVHHAVVDGVGGLRMIRDMLSDDPECRQLGSARAQRGRSSGGKASLGRAVAGALDVLRRQSRALPEVMSLFARLGWANLLGEKDSPLPPFVAPRSLINQEVDARRRVVVCELPLKRLRAIGRHYGGTINDVLVATCGGALRDYLKSQNALPRQSLDAGLPVSVKAKGGDAGNQLSFMVCPFGTNVADPARRLKRVIRATRKAKADIGHLSPTASEDIGTVVMLPFLVMSMTHTSQRFPPVFNTIVSNVPGPSGPLYLDRARLERLYPLSVITDGLGINITAISYDTRLCIAVTACPTRQPDIDALGKRIRDAYRALRATLD